MDDRTPSLDEIFSPRGVAVVGVSGKGMSFAGGVVLALKEVGFPNIYPVNPKYDEVLGLPCFPNLQSIPGPVDHVVVNIPAESSLGLMDDCAAKGVRSVHFFTAGFGESGRKERIDLENTILAKARSGGIRIIGPNCTGLFVPKSRLVNSTGVPTEPGPVGFISQSGGHASVVPAYSGARGLRFSKVVSYGNATDINECELLEYLTQDPETEMIAAYIEGVREGKRFLSVLGRASEVKPVVIYKGGKTVAGRRAALGHTASLTASTAIFDALCRQKQVIPADNVDEMIDALVALRFSDPLPRGTGAALVGAGGGPSVLGSDEMEKAGLQLPRFSSDIQRDLLGGLPLAGSILINPLDTPNLTTPGAINHALETIGNLPDIHMIFYHLGFHPIGSWGQGRFSSPGYLEQVIEAMKASQRSTGKPVLLALRPALDLTGMKEFLTAQGAFVDAGFPVFHSLGQGARAMARVVSWNQRRSQ